MTLFTTILAVCGKVNFCNLSRYSGFSEKTYSRQFAKAFDAVRFGVCSEYMLSLQSVACMGSGLNVSGNCF